MILELLKEKLASYIYDSKHKIEYHIAFWLENKEFFDLEIDETQLAIGLNQYLSIETVEFFNVFLNDKTINLYLEESENPLILEILKNHLNSEHLIEINLESKKIKFLDAVQGKIFQKIYPNVVLTQKNFMDDLSLILIEKNPSITFEAVLKLTDHDAFLITIKNIHSFTSQNSEDSDFFVHNLTLIKTSLTMSFICLSLYSTEAYADNDKNDEAIKMTTKAFANTELGKESLKKIKNNTKEQVNDIINNNPDAKIPMALLGYGVKTLQDNGIKLKHKNDLLLDDTTYEVLLNNDLNFSMKGKNPLMDKSNYEINANTKKIELNVKFDIEW